MNTFAINKYANPNINKTKLTPVKQTINGQGSMDQMICGLKHTLANINTTYNNNLNIKTKFLI